MMALYRLSVKAISRSSGRSAVAAAAYRSGDKLVNDRDGLTHDYTRRSGVEAAFVVTPKGAEWARDRNALWNAAEAAEKRKDACVAREYEVALPAELSPAERRELVQAFAEHISQAQSVAVDVAIHQPNQEGDQRNHHAHVLATTRIAGVAGLEGKADTEKAGRNRKADLEEMRALWARLVNQALERGQHQARVDHRSYEQQGKPNKARGQHMGPAVVGMERRARRSAVRAERPYHPVTDRGRRTAAQAEVRSAGRAFKEAGGDAVRDAERTITQLTKEAGEQYKTAPQAAIAKLDRAEKQHEALSKLAASAPTGGRYPGGTSAEFLQLSRTAINSVRGNIVSLARQQDKGQWAQAVVRHRDREGEQEL